MKPDRRILRQGGLAAAVTAVAVAVAVLLILLADTLESRYALRADMTADRVFALGDETKAYLAALTEPLAITVLTTEESLTGGDVYYLQANEVLRQYAALSPLITLRYIDLDATPGFARDYPQYQLNSSSILVESARSTTTVSLSDLFNTETEFIGGGFAEYFVSSKAEQVMTSAILRVVRARPASVVFLTGFGEGGDEALEELLFTNHYTAKRQNLLLEELDMSADAVVLCAPTRDYGDAEIAQLEDYLAGDGSGNAKTLFYFADVYQPETPNLEAFLAEWGIGVGDGVVRETDQTRLVTGSPYWGVTDYTEDIFAARAMAQGLYTVVPEARPVSLLFEADGARTARTALRFPASAVIQPLGELPAGWSAAQAPQGPFAALAVSEETGGDGAVKARVAAAASSIFISPDLLATPYFGNAEYLLGMFAAVTGQEAELAVAPKTIGMRYLPVSAAQAALLGTVFTVLTPLAVLVAGAVVYMRRRHL